MDAKLPALNDDDSLRGRRGERGGKDREDRERREGQKGRECGKREEGEMKGRRERWNEACKGEIRSCRKLR